MQTPTISKIPLSQLKRGFLAKLLILAACSAAAEDRHDSLFDRLGRTATVASHNSPSSFASYLDKENEKKTVLVPSQEGFKPSEADVWVLFFQNEDEVSLMPEIIQDLYDAMPKVIERPASRYVEFQLSTGGPKAASFHFLENYKTTNENVIACKAAVAVYSGVIRDSNSSGSKKRTKQCESLM